MNVVNFPEPKQASGQLQLENDVLPFPERKDPIKERIDQMLASYNELEQTLMSIRAMQFKLVSEMTMLEMSRQQSKKHSS